MRFHRSLISVKRHHPKTSSNHDTPISRQTPPPPKSRQTMTPQFPAKLHHPKTSSNSVTESRQTRSRAHWLLGLWTIFPQHPCQGTLMQCRAPWGTCPRWGGPGEVRRGQGGCPRRGARCYRGAPGEALVVTVIDREREQNPTPTTCLGREKRGTCFRTAPALYFCKTLLSQ